MIPTEEPPRPPTDLAKRRPLELIIGPGESLHRFFTAIHDPIHFDRGTNGRLNAPDGSYGVLYVAKERRGAFAETFCRNPGTTLLSHDFIAQKAYVELEVRRPLTLAKLAGAGLRRIGATAQVVHGGRPYDHAQSWSAALRAHPRGFDGIAYTARHDDEALCYALFERAADSVREASREPDLDQDWFWKLADLYGIGFAP